MCSRAWRGRDALPRVRRCTSASRSSPLCLYRFFLRLFRFYGRATPDARERIPTAPYVGPRHMRGSQRAAEFVRAVRRRFHCHSLHRSQRSPRLYRERSSAPAQGRTTKAGCESRKKPGTPNGCSLGGLKAAISRMWSWKMRSVLLWLTHITVGRHDAARSRR